MGDTPVVGTPVVKYDYVEYKKYEYQKLVVDNEVFRNNKNCCLLCNIGNGECFLFTGNTCYHREKSISLVCL